MTFDPSAAGRAARNLAIDPVRVRPCGGVPVANGVRHDPSARRAPRHRPGRPGGRVPPALRLHVEQCSGPTANTCPVLNGGTLRARRTLRRLVYDAWASGDSDGSTELIADLRRVHPDVPIVLTFPGVGLSGFDDEPTHGVVALEGQPTGAGCTWPSRRRSVSCIPRRRVAPTSGGLRLGVRPGASERGRRRGGGPPGDPPCATLSRHDRCRPRPGGRLPVVLRHLARLRRGPRGAGPAAAPERRPRRAR